MSPLSSILSLPSSGRIGPSLALSALALVAAPTPAAAKCPPDRLYIGDLEDPAPDATDDTIAMFDVSTATAPITYAGDLVAPPDNGDLDGVMGLVFDDKGGPTGDLLVVNQNFSALGGCGAPPSEVMVFARDSGAFLGLRVSAPAPLAPFAARGMVLGKQHTLYVADLGCSDNLAAFPGRVTRWSSKSGAFLGDLPAPVLTGPYRPRGLAFGPDGDLYVSVVYVLSGRGGAVVRIDVKNGAVEVVHECPTADPSCDLHRPEGLAFSPDGLLYVTSFRADATDVDRILILDPEDGSEADDPIELDLPGDEHRAFAQALLFGPGGYLYVPISGGAPAFRGSVRRYDALSHDFEIIVGPFAAGGPLRTPNYLTFGRTDPATLAYKDHPQCL